MLYFSYWQEFSKSYPHPEGEKRQAPMARDAAYLEAEKKIEQALQSGAMELDLRDMKLTELPESIGQLTQLKKLDLGWSYGDDKQKNQLTTLPDSLGQLMQLQSLDLSNNQLTSLPETLGQLTQVDILNLAHNQLRTIPESIGNLTNLKRLYLAFGGSEGGNPLEQLPSSLRNLRQLQYLQANNCSLTSLPDWLSELSQLEYLFLYKNRLSDLPDTFGIPSSLQTLNLSDNTYGDKLFIHIRDLKQLRVLVLDNCGLSFIPNWLSEFEHLNILSFIHNDIINIPESLAQLEHLENLDLKDNPLNPALQSAYNQGLPALMAYLRSLENAEPLYEAKLVLVGEGNVGKTTLLKALKGKEGAAPQEHEPTTHGVEIDIHGLRLPHPAKNGVEIKLNAWDFGGQDVYRVTHQFFFSRRSLYLLVWEPRRGVQQCQVEDWLNMIRLRVGDDARVIIVSTYSTSGEHIARIDKPVFKQQYGEMIVAFHEVDSLVPDETTGEMVGIAELKKIIAEQASRLEQMGMLFNNNWKAARDELIAHAEPRISYATFGEICAKHGLSQIDTDTLAHLMHDLGYIVHYSDDERLRDDVVLQPQWLTKAIGFVLEDPDTAKHEGILPDNALYKVWHDHAFKDEPRYDPDLYPFFLRLMEKYDVSYRLPDGKASLVAQHVPQVRPDLPWLPEQDSPKDLRRIAMICAMEDDPPGLVPWMIVRTHDYSTELTNTNGSVHRLHWQKGMFLSHPPHGQAMLEKRGREFHLYTRATYPEYFMNVLQETLQKLIKDNWPGMNNRYQFTVPCPEIINGQPCKGRFNIEALRQFLAEGDSTIRCQSCSKRKSIAELLLGFEERPVDIQLREINERLDGLDSRIANYFMAMMKAIANEAKDGPRLFTFRSRDAGLSLKQLFSRPLELQLWCEAEHPHSVIDSGKGVYSIDQPREWVIKIAPYANFVLDVLKTVAPMVAPAINVVKGSKTTETWGITDQLDLAQAIIDKLPAEIKTPDRALSPREPFSEVERSGILALHRLLNELDPTQAKLGLHRITTYTGDYRWLCDHHYAAWQPSIPDKIG